MNFGLNINSSSYKAQEMYYSITLKHPTCKAGKATACCRNKRG